MFGITKRHAAIVAAAVLMVAALVVPANAWNQTPTWQSPGTGIGVWRSITQGHPQEFDFYYNGGNLPAEIVVGADPGNAVGFNVYSDRQWKAFAAGDTSITPVGRGTPNSHEPGNLFWKAQSSAPEFFHVQVYPTTSQTARFWITLTGSGSPGLTAVSPSGNVFVQGPAYVKPGDGRIISIPSQPPPPRCAYGYVWYYGGCRWQGYNY